MAKKPLPGKKKGGSRGSSTQSTPQRIRTLAASKKKWYKPTSWRRAKPVRPPLPKARLIAKASVSRLRQSGRAVFGVTAVYGLGVVLFVRGFSANQDFETLQVLLDGLLTGAVGKLKSVGLQLTFLFGGGGNGTTLPNAGMYQTILLVICSLALIWIFRQTQAKATVSTKRAFYLGMSPLVPFVLVLFIIGLQLLPMAIGSYAYTALVNNGVVVHTWEQLLALTIFLLTILWSFRMVSASMFALYIVTLPGMTPLQAIRSAKDLVFGRRLIIWRKLLLLPFVLLLGTALVILPFLLFLTPLTVWIFFILSTAWFAMIHSYLYTLYRELLDHA